MEDEHDEELDWCMYVDTFNLGLKKLNKHFNCFVCMNIKFMRQDWKAG